MSNTVTSCPDGHRCKNGSSCREIVPGNGNYECDCSTIIADKPFAGKYCDFGATDYCNKEGLISFSSFCTNGECKEYTDSVNDVHRGCDCSFGYAGDHCELVALFPESLAPPTTSSSSPSQAKNQNRAPVIASTLTVTATLVLGLGLYVWYKRRQVRIQSRRISKEVDSASDDDLKEADGVVREPARESLDNTEGDDEDIESRNSVV